MSSNEYRNGYEAALSDRSHSQCDRADLLARIAFLEAENNKLKKRLNDTEAMLASLSADRGAEEDRA